MDNSSTPEDNQELRQSDLVTEWLGESHFIALIIGDLSECLSVLARKRSTLEEKAITRELHLLIAAYGSILTVVHALLPEGDNPQEESLEKMRSFNYRVRVEIDRFLKALRHNLNYVEQYFEYDFGAKLSQEWKFVETAKEILSQLQK